MAWFHDKDGNPSNWREGKFDPEHMMPLLVVVFMVVVLLLK